MTDDEIDKLSGPALDRAIASAMEPNIGKAEEFGPRWSPETWWHNTGGKECRWVPARLFGREPEFIAIMLLEKMKSWEWLCILDQGDLSWRMTANYFGDDQERTCEASGEFAISVARFFLRVVEARKSIAKAKAQE
jgi:hypothetical protein